MNLAHSFLTPQLINCYFVNLFKVDDSGIYSLVIDNQFGTDDTSAQVLVNARTDNGKKK